MLVTFITEYLPGLLMLFVFLAMMIGMYTRKIAALLALPIMAFLFAIIGTVRYVEMFYLLMKFMGEKAFVFLLWSKALWLVIVSALVLLASRKKMSVQSLKIEYKKRQYIYEQRYFTLCKRYS